MDRDEWITVHVNSYENETDLLAKLLPLGKKRKFFVSKVLFHMNGSE